MDRERIIVLKKTLYRDSDLIIRGLNTLGARHSFIATGALKSRRRFGGGVLELTNFIEVVYQPLNRSSIKSAMPRLLEAQIIKEFQGLRRGYELIQVALSLLDLVDRVSDEGIEHGEELFNLLGHGLQTLTQINESHLPLFRLHFLLKFLFQQGVLNIESWMEIFLRTPLRETALLVGCEGIGGGALSCEKKPFSPLVLERLSLIEHKIKAYRETGTLVEIFS